MKNKLFKKFTCAILVVLFGTANFAFSKSLSGLVNTDLIGLKSAAVKLILAMAGIVFFSILLYGGLSVYNSFFVSSQVKDFKLRRDSLKTPEDVDESVIMFISKNRLQ